MPIQPCILDLRSDCIYCHEILVSCEWATKGLDFEISLKAKVKQLLCLTHLSMDSAFIDSEGIHYNYVFIGLFCCQLLTDMLYHRCGSQKFKLPAHRLVSMVFICAHMSSLFSAELRAEWNSEISSQDWSMWFHVSFSYLWNFLIMTLTPGDIQDAAMLVS